MKKPAIISFLAPTGGLGRSKALLQVGNWLAARGLSVLAVDADLASPSLDVYAGGTRGEVGLADFLCGKAELEVRACPSGLRVLGAGSSKSIHRCILGLRRSRSLLSALKKLNVDYVLIDLPPGHLAPAWLWTQEYVRESEVAVGFTDSWESYAAYMEQAWDVWTPLFPLLCVVQGLSRPEQEKKGTFSPVSFWVPRLSALEEPNSPAWNDPKYTGIYENVCRGLIAAISFRRSGPLLRGDWKVVAEALSKTASMDLRSCPPRWKNIWVCGPLW